MNIKKSTYLSVFFLCSFIASFSIGTYQNIQTKSSKVSITYSKSAYLSSKEEQPSNNNDLLLEESEEEADNLFQAQLFVLPFFISFFQTQFSFLKNLSVISLTETTTNPIYIAVCNFRI